MSGFVLNGDTSGTLTVNAPAVAGSNTVTFPAATGIVCVGGGNLLNIQYFTTAGTATYTPTTGTNSVIVEVVGGGGGGGGTAAVASTSGGGGGGGGFASKKITSAFSGVTVTVGAGGTAGATSGSGGAGGTSSFGALLSATGGVGGSSGSTDANSSVGGSGASGDLNILGGSGFSSGTAQFSIGGSSYYAGNLANAQRNTAGIAGQVYGGGATGAVNTTSTARAGAAGASGIVIVYEYA